MPKNASNLNRSDGRGSARPTAFTLVEVVVVTVILAVLGVVAVGRYFNLRDRAAASSEAATVGAVRSAIQQHRLNAELAGGVTVPTALDNAAAGVTSSSTAPFFGGVLSTAITDGWQKGADANTYIGPASNVYVYDPSTGRFSGTGTALAGGGGGGSSVPSTPAVTIATASSWSASGSTLTTGTVIVSGYTLTGNEITLTDSTSAFNEAACRTAVTGQAITAGNYTLELETMLTDYYTQWNYWQVFAVSNTTNLNLSGKFNWGSLPGAKLLAQDWAPPAKSNGSWYTYTNTFTVSAADAAQYSQVIVVMSGSRNGSQQLAWRNVKFTVR